MSGSVWNPSGYLNTAFAQFINFIQRGLGAVTRTVQSKLEEEVSVKDFGAKGDGVTDDTAAFLAAMNYIQTQGIFPELPAPNGWPATKRFKLTGPAAVYRFSAPFIYPVNSRPNYVNFDIAFPGSVFWALPSYPHTNSLMHLKAAFDTCIEGISFRGFKSVDVIFNDSALTQNYGGKTVYKDLRFSECDYGIRHELESVVAIFDNIMTDDSIKRFLQIWRADQTIVKNSFFNWSQLSKSDFDGFIRFGVDQYSPTGEPAFPGNGTYTIGRLAIENCMFIPTGTPGAPVKTAWIDNVSGSVKINECHFGPEAANRPITVLNRSPGATYTGISDLADSSIVIEDSSCATNFDVIYCLNNYPNYIHTRNIRLNVLDYSNLGQQRYILGGDAATLNALSAKYSAPVTQFFSFNIGSGIPQNANIVPVNPALNFPLLVTAYPELKLSDTTNTAVTPSVNCRLDLVDKDGIAPHFAQVGSIYEVYITGNIFSVPAGNISYRTSYAGRIELGKENLSLKIAFVSSYASAVTGLGSTPTFTAVFLNTATNGESTTETLATLAAGNYAIRLKGATNNAGNTWTGLSYTVRRIH